MPIDGRAIIVWEAGGSILPEPIQIDNPGPGEILVRILASGVCHTDQHVYDGKIGTPPILLGHEGAAIVEALGPGVQDPMSVTTSSWPGAHRAAPVASAAVASSTCVPRV
jgi:aryl-alcohol dehydrogenase